MFDHSLSTHARAEKFWRRSDLRRRGESRWCCGELGGLHWGGRVFGTSWNASLDHTKSDAAGVDEHWRTFSGGPRQAARIGTVGREQGSGKDQERAVLAASKGREAWSMDACESARQVRILIVFLSAS